MINLNLDLRKKDGFNKAYTARMGDKGEQFTVTLFDDSLPATIPSGATVTLVVKTTSGKYASTVGTVKGNVVTFTLNGEITSEAGYYQRCYVEVRTTTITRTTQDIIFFSLGNSDISQGDADHYISLLDELLQELNDKFNKWLADREKDYKDLLDRINALNTRLTGLENDVNEIMTKFRLTRAYRMADGTFSKRLPPVNLFSPTQLLQNVVGTTITKTGFKKDNADMIGGWAAEIMNHAQLTKLLKPNTQYTIYYEYKVLSRDTLGAKYVNSSNGTMIIYSGVNPTTYPTVDLRSGSQGFPEEFTNVKVGDILKRGATFTTPSNLNDSASNYRILFYTMRGTDASGKEIVKEAGEFLNIKISTGDDTVIYTTNPQDDPLNAYPKWQGLSLQSSDDPDAYQWELSDDYMSRLKPAWKMENGIWGNVYPRENLWIKNLLINGYISNTDGSIVPTANNPQHKVMNARTAVPSGKVLVWQCWNTDKIVNNSNFTRIAWYKSDNSFISWDAITPLKGEEYLTKTFIPPTGATQCRLSTIVGTPNNTENPNIKHKFELINQGEEPSIFSDAPSDGGLNVYPKYKGLAVDFLDNEIDYQWELSEEYLSARDDRFARDNGYVTYLTNPDLNTLTKSQNVNLQGTYTNGPLNVTAGAHLTVLALNDKTLVQWFQVYSGGRMFIRTNHSSAGWGDWREITTIKDSGYLDVRTNIDLNTISAITQSFVASPPVSNAPTAATHYIEQIVHLSGYVYQRATPISSSFTQYMRQKVANVWTEWVKVETLPSTGALPVLAGSGATDLNNIKTTQEFCVNSAKNTPLGLTTTLYVEVLAHNTTNYVYQRATMIDNNNRSFDRQCVAGTWTPWVEVVKTAPDANLPRVDVTEWKTGWGHYSTNTHLTVRKVNGWVSLNGAFTNTVQFASGSQDEVVVCVLPEGYRPDVDITGLRRNASGTTTYMLGIRTTGEVIYTRHTDPGHSGYVGVQAPGKWFTTNASFIGA